MLKILLGMIVVSLFVLVFYSWKIGLCMMLFSSVQFITLERISSPPANGPANFTWFVKRVGSRKPTLVCLGDSLTHGTCSASYTPDIPSKLSTALGMQVPQLDRIFSNPLWVVNCGQNGMTSHTILHERLNSAIGCHPDYLFLLIGTNDVLAQHNSAAKSHIVSSNELPEAPTMEIYERNLTKILDFIRQASPMVQIGVSTLPPQGENLKSKENDKVRQANEIIERVVRQQGDKCKLVPLYDRMESVLEKKKGGAPFSLFFLIFQMTMPLYTMLPSPFTLNVLSGLFGNTLLSDGIHLNERGRDILVDCITEWLVGSGITKTIALKR